MYRQGLAFGAYIVYIGAKGACQLNHATQPSSAAVILTRGPFIERSIFPMVNTR